MKPATKQKTEVELSVCMLLSFCMKLKPSSVNVKIIKDTIQTLMDNYGSVCKLLLHLNDIHLVFEHSYCIVVYPMVSYRNLTN